MILKVSHKPTPGGIIREPRRGVAVDGAEDLGAHQETLINPLPPCRASQKNLPPLCSPLTGEHREILSLKPGTFSDHMLWMMVRGSNWEYENGNKPGTTEDPWFWTAALCNAFSTTSLFGEFHMATKQLMAPCSDLSNLSRGNLHL